MLPREPRGWHSLSSRPVHRSFPPQAVLGPCFSTGSQCEASPIAFPFPTPPAAEGGGRGGKGANAAVYPTRRKRRAYYRLRRKRTVNGPM